MKAIWKKIVNKNITEFPSCWSTISCDTFQWYFRENSFFLFLWITCVDSVLGRGSNWCVYSPLSAWIPSGLKLFEVLCMLLYLWVHICIIPILCLKIIFLKLPTISGSCKPSSFSFNGSLIHERKGLIKTFCVTKSLDFHSLPIRLCVVLTHNFYKFLCK